MGTADKGQAKQQTIVVGPLAAFVPMKMWGPTAAASMA